MIFLLRFYDVLRLFSFSPPVSLGFVHCHSSDSACGSTWILPLLDRSKQGYAQKSTVLDIILLDWL